MSQYQDKSNFDAALKTIESRLPKEASITAGNIKHNTRFADTKGVVAIELTHGTIRAEISHREGEWASTEPHFYYDGIYVKRYGHIETISEDYDDVDVLKKVAADEVIEEIEDINQNEDEYQSAVQKAVKLAAEYDLGFSMEESSAKERYEAHARTNRELRNRYHEYKPTEGTRDVMIYDGKLLVESTAAFEIATDYIKRKAAEAGIIAAGHQPKSPTAEMENLEEVSEVNIEMSSFGRGTYLRDCREVTEGLAGIEDAEYMIDEYEADMRGHVGNNVYLFSEYPDDETIKMANFLMEWNIQEWTTQIGEDCLHIFPKEFLKLAQKLPVVKHREADCGDLEEGQPLVARMRRNGGEWEEANTEIGHVTNIEEGPKTEVGVVESTVPMCLRMERDGDEWRLSTFAHRPQDDIVGKWNEWSTEEDGEEVEMRLETFDEDFPLGGQL